MVDIKKKKLIIWASTILVVLLVSVGGFFGLKYLTDNDSENLELPMAQTTEEIAASQAKSDRFNEFNQVANTGDANQKLQASIEFGRSTDNNVTGRLNAYRLCIQSAIELKDAVNQEACYQEAMILTNQVISESDKQYWQKYLSDVNSGTPTAGETTDDGSQ